MSWTIACFCGHVYAFEGDCPSCGRRMHEPATSARLSCGAPAPSLSHQRVTPRRRARLVPRAI